MLIIASIIIINVPKGDKKTIKILNDNKVVYLALNDTYKIDSNYKNIKWSSSDETVATIKNGLVKPIKNGTTIITADYNNVKETIEFNISDLFIKAEINNEKDYLPCNLYTEDENDYLDKVLKTKIENAGYKTRAGALAAARFLALEFKYKLAYFYENGRISNEPNRPYVDGEGRYYHIGLYLHESRFDNILASRYGPEIWGCNMYTTTLEIKSPNGLDCSGYVSWLLLNAGFDVGDVGAGINEEVKYDLDDLGEKIIVNRENLNKKNFKVGDLLSRDGHIGILIGMTDDKYYVAEALDYDLHVNTYNIDELHNSDWQYIILLDNLYKNDGKLTNMW